MSDPKSLVDVVTSEIVVEEQERYKSAVKSRVQAVREAKRELAKAEKKLQELIDMTVEEYCEATIYTLPGKVNFICDTSSGKTLL